MPNDSSSISQKPPLSTTYDAIVVGSGISGGWAAKELCEKGLQVLLLERGNEVTHPHYLDATKHPWEFPHRFQLTQDDRETYYVQSRHWSFREDNKHYYIRDNENPYEEPSRFDWIRANVVGGRSLLWSRACYRWSDLDFEANLREGIGVDWPIRYKDLAPWYDYVESFIGVSGSRENLAHLPDGIFQPPFEMNRVEQVFKERVEKKYTNRKVIIGRTANLTAPLPGRGLCQARDLCHRGCPYGAYFSSPSSTIPAARATGKLTVLSGALVNRVIYNEKKGKATGVEVIDVATHQVQEYFARLIFLNASTLGTAFILLNSNSGRFPQGLGNDSGQVGLNLMDHHKGLSASAQVEGYEDWYYRGRRPTPIYIPRFKNVFQKDASFLRGYHFGGSAYRPRGGTADAIGDAYKEALTEPGGWMMGLYGFGECLPYPENRVTLNRDQKDRWGRPLLRINCSFKENERAMNADMGIAAAELLEAAGFKQVTIKNTLSFPGNANHEMGIARMGRDPRTSVLNGFNQMHAVRNVFITDGSCMTSGSCVNPSLTYMALTARACNYAITEMKKGNL